METLRLLRLRSQTPPLLVISMLMLQRLFLRIVCKVPLHDVIILPGVCKLNALAATILLQENNNQPCLMIKCSESVLCFYFKLLYKCIVFIRACHTLDLTEQT